MGWRFSVFCCESEAVGESALAVFYAPEKEQMPLFEDCVMSVKYMDGRQRCAVLGEPDEYGCAMGCARHCDYDVCGCDRKDGQLACLLGTMLFPLSGIRRLPDEASKADFGEARFFTVTDSGLISDLSSEALSRRYLICVDDSLSDAALGKICRGDGFVAPVYLREDRGICCSGFLKYI
ncbi:MAG: hypothetical protein LUI07_00790 [Lachnospiraceae bacterium]|nr:hypothetical protein [Lachnospiraceae bacterium]